MLIKQKKIKKRYNKIQSFGGNGIFDSLLSAITSNAVKEVGINLSKTAATKLGEKAIEKVTDKIFSSKKERTVSSKDPDKNKVNSEISPRSKMLVDAIISKGRGIRRI